MYLDEYLRVLPGPAKRAVYRAVWNPDKWNRQSLVASLVDGWETGLDVGGRASEMDALCSVTRFISCNLKEPADVLLSRSAAGLPFPNNAFDVVTSSDVIEHIPAEARSAHLDELLRVAARRVAVCFPFGSQPHVEAERGLASDLEGLGLPVPEFLEEHLEFGLPGPNQVAELAAAAADTRSQVWFQGDFAEGDAMLVAAMRLRFLRDPEALGPFLSMTRRVRTQNQLLPTPGPRTARVFIVFDIDG